MGVYTGADMTITHTFHEAMMGLLGQEHLFDENRVWITKTHFPFGKGNEAKFSARKMFCIVRNPLDVIPSYAYLANMMSHSLVPREKLHERFPAWWAEWVKKVATLIKENHE